jgi:hypothetical protein
MRNVEGKTGISPPCGTSMNGIIQHSGKVEEYPFG